MSDITNHIAAIIEEHFNCEEIAGAEHWGEVAQHIAEEIDKVFGFVEETETRAIDQAGLLPRTWTSSYRPNFRHEHRYVTKWEAK